MTAIKPCNITIRLDDGEDLILHSDKELDAWIYKHRASLEEFFLKDGKFDKTFSLSEDPVKEALAKLKKAETPTMETVFKHAKATKEAVSAHKAAIIGATTIYRHVGDPEKWTIPLADYSRLNSKKKSELEASGKSKTEIDSILKVRTERFQDYGTDIHTMTEYAFGKDPDGNIVDALPYTSVTGMKIITSGALKNATYTVVQEAVNKIKALHKNAQKIYTEREIYSKDVDNQFLKILNEIKGISSPNGQPYSHVIGKPDILVVNADGSVSIYDVKTSHTKIGDSWSESTWYDLKKDEVEAQLMTYAAILEQHGIVVKDIRVVSIVGIPDSDDDSVYTSFSFDNIVSIPRGSKIDLATKVRFRSQTKSDPENVTKLNSTFEAIYPSTNEFLKTSLANREIEQIKNSKQVEKKETDSGTKWVLYKDGITGGGTVWFDSEEALDKALADYVPVLNAARKTEMLTFGTELAKLCRTNDREGLIDWAKHISKANFENNIANFRKYVMQGWTLVSQPEWLSQGIFVFQLGQRSEVVMLGIGDLHQVFTGLEKGKTILGSTNSDTEYGTDSSFVLNANRGHLLEMKALMFIAQNQDLFKSCPVGRIKVVTLHNGTRISDSNAYLQENYKRLHIRNREVLPYLPESMFMDDTESCLLCAEDILLSMDGMSIANPNLSTDLKEQYTIDDLDEITDLIVKLKNEISRSGTNFNDLSPSDPRYLAYSELLKAYAYAHVGINSEVTSEEAKGKIFSHGINPDGTFMQSFASSDSENLRRFDRVRHMFSRKIVLEFEEKYARPWQHLMEEVYKEVGDPPIGGEWRFFKDWFEIDPNTGKISESFKLKDPQTDDFFKTRPAQKKACEFFLRMINQGRSKEQIERGEYFNVPLVRGDFWEQLAHNDIKTAIKEQLNNWYDPVREGLQGAPDESKTKLINSRTENELSLWNPFLSWTENEREEFITKKGVGYFSTNLDSIFLSTMAWQAKVNACKTFLPSLQAFRVLMRIENKNNGARMQEIEDALTWYMDRIVFNQNPMENSLQGVYGILAAIKSVISKVALSFKLSSLMREGGTSSIQIAVAKAYGSGHGALMHDFNEASYTEALVEMGQMTIQSVSVLNKVHQLNAMFGISDFGFSKMADSSKSRQYAPLNIEESFAFWTSSASDFFHRNAMLVMKLKSINAWDAYYEDENGDVKYDWTKDGQYDVYQKYKTYKECPVDFRSKWRDQRDKYLSAIEEWKMLGDEYMSLKEGDPLPHALTPSDLHSLKTQSDLLFGNYDEETKSVMMHTFLGSLFMQFKIYGYARLLRYIKTPGAVNILIREPKKEINPKTGKLEKVAIVVNEDGTNAEYKFESEVTDSEWDSGRAKIYRETNGAYVEGNFYSLIPGLHAIMTLNLTNFKAILQDPVKKYNLLMILWDSLFAMLLSALIGVLFGEDVIENIDKEDWFTQWSYGIASGIAQDGPIWQVAKGLYSDGTLPMLTSLKRYVSTASSVLHGNTNIVSATLNTFGATRELSHYFDDL